MMMEFGRFSLRRSLDEMRETFSMLLAAEEPPESAIARLDPRAKLIGTLLLIVAASTSHSMSVLAAMLALSLALLALSRVSLRRMLRILAAVPVFTCIIILPATTNLVAPGRIILALWTPDQIIHFGPWQIPREIGITVQGLLLAARFILRAITCVSLAGLLATTMRASELLAGLRRLGMPRMAGMILAMMHRYLILLVRVASELHEARLSRPVRSTGLRAAYRWASAGIGIIFRRTWDLGQEVFEAMISRGYDGNVRMAPASRLKPGDWIWLAGCVVAAAGARFIEMTARSRGMAW